MTIHHNAVRGAITVGGTGNVTFAATASGKARPFSVIAPGWQGGIRFDDANGVDWEVSSCTALGNNVFSRDTLRHSSTGATINLAVGSIGQHVAIAEQFNAMVSRASVTGTYAVGQTLNATYPEGIVGTIQYTRTQTTSPFTKTAISGAVATAVNSLAYTITSADAGYNIGIDCSNQVSSAGGGLVPAAQATVRTAGFQRLIGTQNQQSGAAAMNGTSISAVIKLQAPGGAIGARVVITNGSPTFGMAYAKAAMASTEISACDTVNNAYTPIVGGQAFNVISPSTSDKGFVKATWGGATKSRRIYPSNAVLPSFGYNNQEEMIVSDVIPLVPVRATDRTKEEYNFLCRVSVFGTNGQDGISQIEGGSNKTASNLYSSWLATKDNTGGADAPLMCVGGLNNSTDAVDGTLTLSTGIANGWSPVVHIEWVYPSGVTPVSIWHIGNSLTEGYEWPRWAVNRKNTNPLRPLSHANLGGSTTRTGSFVGGMYLHLQALGRPNHIVFEMMSPNNYSPASNFTVAAAADEVARLKEIAQYVTALGIKMHFWTPINWGANPTDPADMSTAWNYLYNSMKPWCAANNVGFCDINGDSQVSRTDYNATSNPGGWLRADDHLHPSDPTGKAGFARVYSDYLTSIGI